MNRYLKLVSMEMHRFWKLYAALLVITTVSQFGGLLYHLQNYMSTVEKVMTQNSWTSYADYRKKFGPENFHSAIDRANLWFFGPVFLCIAAMAFYVFFIWYRDWAGKNTFAYRLLMLPTSRMNLFWSKLTAIIVFVLGLVAFQLVLLPLHMFLYGQMIPAELGLHESVAAFVRNHSILKVLIPQTFSEFALYYGAGILGVAVVFTAILMERSYRLRGLLGGLLYATVSGAAMLAPTLIYTGGATLYPIEAFILQIGLGIILLGVSIVISWYLINRKVAV